MVKYPYKIDIADDKFYMWHNFTRQFDGNAWSIRKALAPYNGYSRNDRDSILWFKSEADFLVFKLKFG